ncbi:MAG TPA: zinc ribbon domain-containing protein [Gemmatimonadales bacterium]|nr:zinc ribbon domain-containing protein [Gemmatimonadales bacterium]
MSGITACPTCGAQSSGNFCNNCGSPLGKLTCPKCQGSLRRGARFCPQCGAAAPWGSGGAPANRTPWIVSGVIGVALLGMILFVVLRGQPGAPPSATAAAPFASSSGSGTPPDLSTMTPRERFDRLYNRIMTAQESGDQATVEQFTPMALMAFDQLDVVDADARYHLALLKVHGNDVAAVSAIADTILQKDPGHLFGYMIRGAVARFQKDDAAKKRAYADFLSHYDAEIARGRPEYTDHQRAVDEFLKAAKEGS